MKLKLLVFSTLISFYSLGVLVQMPDAHELNNRISRLGFEHFIEKTNLINKLANRSFEAVSLSFAIDCICVEYSSHRRNDYSTMSQEEKNVMALQVGSRKLLLEKLLQHNHEAILELKEKGLL